MAFNNYQPQALTNQTNLGMAAPPQQQIQPLFPQPQGNVYNINSTLEVANVPCGAGISVALCLPENVMYIKTMQNGNPLFYPYKITPFTNDNKEEKSTEKSQPAITLESLQAQIKECYEKINSIESKIPKKKKAEEDWQL